MFGKLVLVFDKIVRVIRFEKAEHWSESNFENYGNNDIKC